jgi:hypothetical protein
VAGDLCEGTIAVGIKILSGRFLLGFLKYIDIFITIFKKK